MEINILWSGREYFSLENCLIKPGIEGNLITSTIVGYYEEKIYKVDYRIETDAHWHTRVMEIHCSHDHHTFSNLLQADGHGRWTCNGMPVPELDGCIDVDIPVTPFTNTLPIRRLQLQYKETREISVVYCDVLARNIGRVAQQYTCLSDTAYHYQNVPNDFEATIRVDRSGFVVDYPELFVRKALSIHSPQL